MIFVYYEGDVVTYGPSFSHDLVLAAMLQGTVTFRIRRYTYEDIMKIRNVWKTSPKGYLFRIMNHEGNLIWSDRVSLIEALGEFTSRSTPFIPYAQRAAHMDRVTTYSRDQIMQCFRGMFHV